MTRNEATPEVDAQVTIPFTLKHGAIATDNEYKNLYSMWNYVNANLKDVPEAVHDHDALECGFFGEESEVFNYRAE